MTVTEYPIVTADGKKFCMCSHDDNGNIVITSKQGSIPLVEFQKQVFCPEIHNRSRGKRKK